MTTQQVADRFYELAKESKWDAIQDQLFSNNAVSIEPPEAAAQVSSHHC